MSADNVKMVAEAGFDHLLATRLHRDRITTEALRPSGTTPPGVEIPGVAAAPPMSHSKTAPARLC